MSSNPAESLTSAYFYQKLDGQEKWIKHICGKDLIMRAKTWENEQNQLMIGTIFFDTLDPRRMEKSKISRCPQCRMKLTDYLDEFSNSENWKDHNKPVHEFYKLDMKPVE